MITAAVGTVYRYCRPLFHHAQRFVAAGFQLTKARSLTAGKGRCVHCLYRWPLAYVEIRIANAAYGQTCVVVFTSPPVASQRGRWGRVPVAVGYYYVARAVGVVYVQLGLYGLGSAVAYLALRIASGEHIHIEDASGQTCDDGVCALAQQRCHVVGGVENGLFIFRFARFEYVLRYWTAIQRHCKHTETRRIEPCAADCLSFRKVEVASKVRHSSTVVGKGRCVSIGCRIDGGVVSSLCSCLYSV